MWDSQSIQRSDALPLYHQIFLLLRGEITSGARLFGDTVPTEQNLAVNYGVSRITARRALDELAAHGLVERRRRTGTRVIYRSPTLPMEADLDQALESLLTFGRNTQAQVLELTREQAGGEVAALLSINAQDGVLRAVRLRLMDGEPLGQVVSYIPASLGVFLTRQDLTEMPLLALLTNHGLQIGGGTQTVSAHMAGARLAKLLAVEVHAPLLRIERTVSDVEGRPILFTRASYRADRYRLSMGLNPSRKHD